MHRVIPIASIYQPRDLLFLRCVFELKLVYGGLEVICRRNSIRRRGQLTQLEQRGVTPQLAIPLVLPPSWKQREKAPVSAPQIYTKYTYSVYSGGLSQSPEKWRRLYTSSFGEYDERDG